MKISNIVTTKQGHKKIEVHLTKEDEIHLLEYALSDLLQRGAATVVQERDKYLLDLEVEGHG